MIIYHILFANQSCVNRVGIIFKFYFPPTFPPTVNKITEGWLLATTFTVGCQTKSETVPSRN